MDDKKYKELIKKLFIRGKDSPGFYSSLIMNKNIIVNACVGKDGNLPENYFDSIVRFSGSFGIASKFYGNGFEAGWAEGYTKGYDDGYEDGEDELGTYNNVHKKMKWKH